MIASIRQERDRLHQSGHISKLVTVSVGEVSKFRRRDLIIVDHEVAVNGAYYCEMRPSQKANYCVFTARSVHRDNQSSGTRNNCVHFIRPLDPTAQI